MRADAVEFCGLQGPHALQLLAGCTRGSPPVLRAWQAACAVADNDPPAALDSWLDFLLSYQWGHPSPVPILLVSKPWTWRANPNALSLIEIMFTRRQAGMALDHLLKILSRPADNEALQGLLLATRAFTSAWQAGDASMRCWQVADVSKLGALSAHAVHLFLHQEAEVCKAPHWYVERVTNCTSY